MSQRLPMELRVAGWMADEGDGAMPDALVAAVLERTSDLGQRPQVVALVLEPPLRIRQEVLVGSRALRYGLLAAAILLAALAAVAASILLRPPAPDAWPSFRGGSDRAGVGRDGPVGHPVERWHYDAGAPITGNLSLSDDVVLAPSDDGVLHALDVATGSERWRWTPGATITGPTAADGVAYVSDGAGTVHAVDVATGGERWRSPIRLEGASVAVVGGDLLYLGTGNGFIVALDRASGTERWRTQVSPGAVAVRAPALGSDMVVAATGDGSLVALRAGSGERAWGLDGLGSLGTPVLAGGLVSIGAAGDEFGGSLLAVGLADGQVRWRNPEALFSPSVAGQLAINGSNGGVVTARDLVSGAERWRVGLAGTNRAPAIAGSVAYVVADGLHQVVALDLATGGELWRLPVNDTNSCCIAAAGGLVLFATDNGIVYAIGGDGAQLTPAPSSGTPTSIPSGLASVAPTPIPTPTPVPTGPTATPAPSVAADVLAIRARFPAADLGLDRPIALAVAGNGDIYVTDASDHVTRIAPDGTVRSRWGGHGIANGKFDFIPAQTGGNVQGSITVGPDGKVYVSDSDNHRVQVFTAEGDFIRTFGSLDPAAGGLIVPADIGVDADGNVYVADDSAQLLHKFDATGDLLWSVTGSDDERLLGHLHGLLNDDDGNLVAINDDTGFALVLDTDGHVLDSYRTGGCSPSSDAAGNLWVGGCGWEDVRVFDPQHRLIGLSTGLGLRSPKFGPEGEVVSLDADGSVVLLDVNLP